MKSHSDQTSLQFVELSRADLYDLVWAYPLSEIAKFHGIASAQIAQVCDALDIARPEAGYWQKLAYGKPVEREPLCNTRYSADQPVIFE